MTKTKREANILELKLQEFLIYLFRSLFIYFAPLSSLIEICLHKICFIKPKAFDLKL